MVIVTLTEDTDTMSSKITKEDRTNVDLLVLVLPISTSINIGDTVNYYDKTPSLIFSGIVQSIKKKERQTVVVHDHGAELNQRTVNKIYSSQSPEDIIQDVLTNYTTLTYVSTIVSGVTIDTYVARDKLALDIVNEMAELMLANYYVDKSKNFMLELAGDTASSKTITTGIAMLNNDWEENKNKLINSATVEGDRLIQEVSENFAGPSTQINLAEIPIDVNVTVGGTEKTGYVTGSSVGDYTVDRDNKQINFDSSSSTIVVKYTYSIPVKVRKRNATSINTYGQHDKKYLKPYIKNRDQAREYAEYIVDKFSNPLLQSTWAMKGTTEYDDFESYLPNNTIFVDDTIRSITKSLLIKKVVREFPGKLLITVGDTENDIVFWSKEIQLRVKELEQRDDNSTTLTEDEVPEVSIQIQATAAIDRQLKRTIPSGVMYFGKPRNWDDRTSPSNTYVWSDRTTWGHPDDEMISWTSF